MISSVSPSALSALAVSNRKWQGPTLLDKDLLIAPFKLFINGSFYDEISQLWLDSWSIKTKNTTSILPLDLTKSFSAASSGREFNAMEVQLDLQGLF